VSPNSRPLVTPEPGIFPAEVATQVRFCGGLKKRCFVSKLVDVNSSARRAACPLFLRAAIQSELAPVRSDSVGCFLAKFSSAKLSALVLAGLCCRYDSGGRQRSRAKKLR
jgi:hypothetical protein